MEKDVKGTAAQKLGLEYYMVPQTLRRLCAVLTAQQTSIGSCAAQLPRPREGADTYPWGSYMTSNTENMRRQS